VSAASKGWGKYLDSDGEAQFRYCAALRLSHPTQNPVEWSSALGLEPCVTDLAGMPRVRGKYVRSPAKESFWVHEFNIDEPGHDIDEFLDSVANRLSEKAAFFERLIGEGGHAEIYFGFFLERSNTGFALPAKLQRRLAHLHLDLVFSIYDFNEEEDVPPETEAPST
jgi:hypothetical protein